MGPISIGARAAARNASLFVACSSAAAALAFPASPAGAGTLPYLTVTRTAATSVGSCPTDALASLAEPMSVDKPQIARDLRADGTTTLRVDLSSKGQLTGESVMTSTRNWWLDHAALDAVRLARFQPETHDCRQVAGSYLVDVVFLPED